MVDKALRNNRLFLLFLYIVEFYITNPVCRLTIMSVYILDVTNYLYLFFR